MTDWMTTPEVQKVVTYSLFLIMLVSVLVSMIRDNRQPPTSGV